MSARNQRLLAELIRAGFAGAHSSTDRLRQLGWPGQHSRIDGGFRMRGDS
jgi:hypothetical protein